MSITDVSGVADSLAADFPGWHIWRGRTEAGAPCGWYATRLGKCRAARDGRNGLFMTVSGNTAAELRAQLDVQAQREAQL